MSVKTKIENTLTRVADTLGITSYHLSLDETALRGDGFLSEFYTGSVTNKDTGETIEIYIKYPPPRDSVIPMSKKVFENENRYYSIIYPELQRFQKEKGIKEPFNKIPVFYCGDGEPSKACIVLENLKLQNYILWDKTKFFDEKHLKELFETYGRYHALTFAFKEQNQEKQVEITQGIHDIFAVMFGEEHHLLPGMLMMLKVIHASIQEIDENKAEKLVPLMNDIKTFFDKGIIYEGKHSALTHGDCWSNNIMFKYDNNGNIENLRLIDHQLVRESTPVHDLSYFFYAGASKKDFDKLDQYLEIYYKNFCSFAKQLGSHPEKLLPYDVLKADWKTYSLLGIKMALLVWHAKLMSKQEVVGVGEGGIENAKLTFHKIVNSDVFKENTRDILLHAIEYGII